MIDRPDFVDELRQQLHRGASRMAERRGRRRRLALFGAATLALAVVVVGAARSFTGDGSTRIATGRVESTVPSSNVGDDAPDGGGDDQVVETMGDGDVMTTVVGDGTTVSRIRADDGSVFALRLPEVFGQGLVPDDASGGIGGVDGATLVMLRAPTFGARIEVGFCGDEQHRVNALGLWVGPARLSRPPPNLSFCRPDEFLRLVIEPVPEVELDADQFDIVPIRFGDRYVDWIADNVGFDRQCCFEDRGPMGFADLLVVSDGVGSTQVTGLDSATLAPRWTTDLARLLIDGGGDEWVGDGSFLYLLTDSGTVVATTGYGHLVALAAETGDLRWHLDLDGESPRAVRVVDDARLVVTSDVSTEGDLSPPTVRLVAIETGAEIWAASGSPATDLQGGGPVILGRRVLVADVPSGQTGVDGATASVTAFDLETGDQLWTAPLDSGTEAYASFETIVADDGRGVLLATSVDGTLFRLDPATGARLWASEVGFGPIVGLSPETVTVLVRGQELEIDLGTGRPR